MPHNKNYLYFVLDQLSEFENFTFKKMVGGIGFFRDGHMFGIISGGKFRLVASKEVVNDYSSEEQAGDLPMHGENAYYEVPDEVLHDKKLLKKKAKRALKEVLKTYE